MERSEHKLSLRNNLAVLCGGSMSSVRCGRQDEPRRAFWQAA